MAQRVRIWFDSEGDFLEVVFSDKAGYMRETDNHAVMGQWARMRICFFSFLMHVGQVAKGKPPVAGLPTTQEGLSAHLPARLG